MTLEYIHGYQDTDKSSKQEKEYLQARQQEQQQAQPKPTSQNL